MNNTSKCHWEGVLRFLHYKNLTCFTETFLTHQFSSAVQLYPTLCDPMDCSMPDLSVPHQLPEFTQTYVHWVSDALNLLIFCRPLLLPPSIFQASGSFQMSQFSASSGQKTGVSASASVLPMNIQDWFPLGWTGWFSLQSKGLSRVFSNTTVSKYSIMPRLILMSRRQVFQIKPFPFHHLLLHTGHVLVLWLILSK